MFFPISTLTVCALSALLLVLSFRVIGTRQSRGVSLGDGEDEMLQRRIRAQGNLVEYAPFAMVLVLCAELQIVTPGSMIFTLLLSVTAAAFVLGRVLHGYALSFTKQNARLRILGMQLTIFAMIGLVFLNLAALVM
ncbi:MAG: MAPEG family protein [Ahrensia sp.]|nr:MAPEG family protein [Ahrensia sp.]